MIAPGISANAVISSAYLDLRPLYATVMLYISPSVPSKKAVHFLLGVPKSKLGSLNIRSAFTVLLSRVEIRIHRIVR